MSQKLPVSGFKWVEDFSEFNEGFIKSYNEKSKEGYFLEADIQYSENLYNVKNSLPFLPEKQKIEKVEKYVANLLDENMYSIHKRNLTQTLSYGLVF